jgi:LPXTG-motif cell wall-anchored protein
MRRAGIFLTGIGVTSAAVALSAGSSGAAPVQAVIDFEDGLGSGDIVTTLDVGLGISGEDFGSVAVFGQRLSLPGVNQAMIFDAECDGAAATCSGEDDDLFQPQLGNVLIISEDGDSADPDDADVGERIDFDFSSWGTGVVTVVSIDVLDVEDDESPGVIEMGAGSVPIPDIGDGNVATVPVGLSGSALAVVLNGSGAIDNIVIEFEPPAATTTTTTTTEPTTTTTIEPTTTTTVSPTTTPGPTTTVANLPPQVPITPAPTPVTQLPATGGGAGSTAVLAAGLLALGFGLLTLSRRPARS